VTFDVAQALLTQPGNRKKKRYVLHLVETTRSSVQESKIITRAVGQAMPEHTLIRLEDPDEALKVLLLKNVELMILDHTFFDDDVLSVEYAAEVKKRKKCPVFFTTRSQKKLIESYRTLMTLYEEMDDYAGVPLDPVELARKFRRAATLEGRTAKRFPVQQEISLHRIDNDSVHKAKLVDLSLVGFGVEVSKELLLARTEQLRIQIPLVPFGLFHPQYGEWIKLAGRVRRVSIHGQVVGCSFEHLTPLQSDCLTRILEQAARKARMAQLQTAKTKETVA
jgi:hypothetical protein